MSNSHNDSDLFRQSMAELGVRPMRATARHRPASAPTRTPASPTSRQPRNRLPAPAARCSMKVQYGSLGSVSAARPGPHKNTIKALKSGRIQIQSCCDLHGLDRHEATAKLRAFIAEARSNDEQYLLIIHGKGHRSTNQQSVLKPLTINWLRAAPEVLAFCSAQPKDGGTGAVYVLLARG